MYNREGGGKDLVLLLHAPTSQMTGKGKKRTYFSLLQKQIQHSFLPTLHYTKRKQNTLDAFLGLIVHVCRGPIKGRTKKYCKPRFLMTARSSWDGSLMMVGRYRFSHYSLSIYIYIVRRVYLAPGKEGGEIQRSFMQVGQYRL